MHVHQPRYKNREIRGKINQGLEGEGNKWTDIGVLEMRIIVESEVVDYKWN